MQGDWKNVAEVEDFPEGFDLEVAVTETLDGWFGDRKTVPTEEFIDRFVRDHSGDGTYDPNDNWDMDSYDSPAARAILRTARRIKREQG